jgi:hypothetical protein
MYRRSNGRRTRGFGYASSAAWVIGLAMLLVVGCEAYSGDRSDSGLDSDELLPAPDLPGEDLPDPTDPRVGGPGGRFIGQ